jgi:hypothetical protein
MGSNPSGATMATFAMISGVFPKVSMSLSGVENPRVPTWRALQDDVVRGAAERELLPEGELTAKPCGRGWVVWSLFHSVPL